MCGIFESRRIKVLLFRDSSPLCLRTTYPWVTSHVQDQCGPVLVAVAQILKECRRNQTQAVLRRVEGVVVDEVSIRSGSRIVYFIGSVATHRTCCHCNVCASKIPPDGNRGCASRPRRRCSLCLRLICCRFGWKKIDILNLTKNFKRIIKWVEIFKITATLNPHLSHLYFINILYKYGLNSKYVLLKCTSIICKWCLMYQKNDQNHKNAATVYSIYIYIYIVLSPPGQ